MIFSASCHSFRHFTSLLPVTFSSEMKGTRSKSSLLQQIYIVISTMNTNPKYTDGIRLRNLASIRPPLNGFCDKQEKHFSLFMPASLF